MLISVIILAIITTHLTTRKFRQGNLKVMGEIKIKPKKYYV